MNSALHEVTAHRAHDGDTGLRIEPSEHRTPGGAPASYRVYWNEVEGVRPKLASLFLPFQLGPVADGVNGLTNEALLAVVADRLEAFQAGPYACPENGLALSAVKQALGALHARTRDRRRRGVEGQLTR